MTTNTSFSPINRKATIAFVCSIITILAFCVGLLPIPFTVLICYPPGILMGITALVLGIQALREMRDNGERGRTLAMISVWVGGLMILASICVAATGVLLWPYVSEFAQQVWTQIRH